MADWMSQQVSEPDDVDEDEDDAQAQTESDAPDDRTEFEKQLRTLLTTNALETLDESVVAANIDECTDADALEKAVEIEERDGPLQLYQDRLAELRDDADPESDADPAPESETESEPADDPEPESDADAAESDAEPDTTDADDSPNPFVSSDSDGRETAESADDDADDDAPETTMTDDTSSPTTKADGNGGVAVESIAPDAMTVSEAANRDRRWTSLIWAEPGMGKSHFAMSAKSPVVVLDTEGKADELAHKFQGGEFDDPFIFQPSDFDGAKQALEQALELLDAYREQQGVVGTIVVDSMSVMWGWSQQKYVDKFYPNANDPSEVELSTGFGSGKSDWKQIKNYHNVQFRQKMIDSPYHLVWTAMSEDDYDAQLNDDDRSAEKPAGEKENVYKVDEVIRLREGSDGAPVAELQKSGKVKHRYTGLRYPDFDKHQQVIEAVDDAETSTGTIASVESNHNVTVVEGNPAYIDDDE